MVPVALVDIIMVVTVVIIRVTTRVEVEAMEETVMIAMVMVSMYFSFYAMNSLCLILEIMSVQIIYR